MMLSTFCEEVIKKFIEKQPHEFLFQVKDIAPLGQRNYNNFLKRKWY